MSRIVFAVVGSLCFWSCAIGQERLPYDFDLDGALTVNDIDLFSRVNVAQASWFDLDRNGTIDFQDHQRLVHDFIWTWSGDVNLDGSFDSTDLVQMFQAGEWEDDQPLNSTWSEGDLDGDAEFTSLDLVLAFRHGHFEAGPRPGHDPPTWEIPGDGIRKPTPGSPGWFGDFDLDQQFTSTDIDLLASEIRKGPTGYSERLFADRGFDVSGDGAIDHYDLQQLIHDGFNTWIGDANLDGEVCETSDIILAFQAGEYADNQSLNSTWAEGDWNADLEFDSEDFVAMFSIDCPEIRPRPSVVPEPVTWPGLGGVLLLWRRRRKHMNN